MADWSELLPELVFEIAKALNFYEDFLSFLNVCSSWQSAIEGYKPDRLPCRLPSVMIMDDEIQDECQLHLLDGNVRKVQLPKGDFIYRTSIGSWVLKIEYNTTDPKLFNIFSGRQIDLPTLDSLPYVDRRAEYKRIRLRVFKVFISSDPTVEQDDYVVMIIFASCGWLAFCRPGDSVWKYVKEGWIGEIYDLVYHNGKVYTFDDKGFIQSCEIDGRRIQSPTSLLQFSNKSLIGFEDDIRCVDYDHILLWNHEKLVVIHEIPNEDEIDHTTLAFTETDYRIESFSVFQCDLETGEWSKMDNLGNRAIFVGVNPSFFLEAYGCVKPNCIYFTDLLAKDPGSRMNNGIYHLSDGSIQPLVGMRSVSYIHKQMWIAPPSL